jgi:hypothetical protein
MLLTITTTHRPANDLGYLLHKHPDRFQSFDLSFGKAHVYYPEVGAERCTACLLLDVDPVGMVRRNPPNAYRAAPSCLTAQAFSINRAISSRVHCQFWSTELSSISWEVVRSVMGRVTTSRTGPAQPISRSGAQP